MSVETAIIVGSVASVASAAVAGASAYHSMKQAEIEDETGRALAKIERQRAEDEERERLRMAREAIAQSHVIAGALGLDPISRTVQDLEFEHARAALADVANIRLNARLGASAVRQRAHAVSAGYFGQGLSAAGQAFTSAADAYRGFAIWQQSRGK